MYKFKIINYIIPWFIDGKLYVNPNPYSEYIAGISYEYIILVAMAQYITNGVYKQNHTYIKTFRLNRVQQRVPLEFWYSHILDSIERTIM